MRAHAGQEGALDSLAFLGAVAFVHQYRRAGFSEYPQQIAFEIVVYAFIGILADAQAHRDVSRFLDGRQWRDIRSRVLDAEYFARPRGRNVGQAFTRIRAAWEEK